MTEAKSHTRLFELLSALVMTIAMAALILIIQRYSITPVSEIADTAESSQDSSIIFPDFASIESIDIKKQQFFDYLQVYVEAENTEIVEVRRQLSSYAALVESGVGLSRRERAHLLQIARFYELDVAFSTDQKIISALLVRVDVIPISLVLAQAASESAWGTSRFALEGYNLFGHYCYEEGCGIVPERRVLGATHEVKRFDSVASAVEAYFLNINSHYVYKDFRETRARMRRQQKELDPMELAYGLGGYSVRGDNYIREVKAIIEQNSLRQRDRS